jgi:hypothetical protein
MEGMGEIFGTLASARLSRRLSRRARAEEARVNDEPPKPGHEKNLSEHIPSSLISTADRVRALAVGGAPAWSRRLKRIHDLTEAAVARLADQWQTHATAVQGDRSRFAVEWRRHAECFDFGTINDLIARHNRFFPAEANLAMDPRTGDYVLFAGGDYRRRPLDAAWILGRFPADLQAALASPPRSESRRIGPLSSARSS